MFGILKVYVSFLTPKLPGRTTQKGGWGRSMNAVKLTRPVCLFMHRMREVAMWPLWPWQLPDLFVLKGRSGREQTHQGW